MAWAALVRWRHRGRAALLGDHRQDAPDGASWRRQKPGANGASGPAVMLW